jgi:adenylyltransferase/sulfurtransferase
MPKILIPTPLRQFTGKRDDPLGELPKRVAELDREADIVVHCKSGMRSAKACGILRNAGFPHVRNVKGGILAWSREVDPSVPAY